MNEPHNQANQDEVEWNLLHSARGLIRRRRFIFGCTLLGLLVGALYAFYLKPYYTAQAVFLPPQPAELQSVPSLFANFDSSDVYLGMLTSRTVADDVIDHVGLMKIYHAPMRLIARQQLSGASKFLVSKGSFIEVQITTNDPRLSAQIADAYLEALYRLNGQMSNSNYDHRRVYLESQLQSARDSLAQAEVDLKNTQKRTGIVLPAGEAQAGLSATMQLQSQIEADETRLAGLLVSRTDQSAEVIELRSELNQLRAQLVRQQSDVARHGPGTGIASTGDLPELTLEYAQKDRELRLRESVFDNIVQLYEKARFASTDPGPQLQIVDRAEVPERKSGPPRRYIAFIGMLTGFAASFLYILFKNPVLRIIRSLREPPAVTSEPHP